MKQPVGAIFAGNPNVSGTTLDEVFIITNAGGESQETELVTKDNLFTYENTADYGMLPTNSSSENVAAFNAATLGGNKTLLVSVPGVYLLSDTVWIDDNTEIICGEGVFFKKDVDYWNMFCNRGALTREWNENISLKGFNLIMDGHESGPATDDNLYGLRGSINMFYIRNLSIRNFYCGDIGIVNWPIHICTWENVEIIDIEGKGEKDFVHVGTGEKLYARNITSMCYDDTFGLNSFDYPESNPEIGDIKDVVIENLEWNHNPDWGTYGGRVINFQLGAVGELEVGYNVERGDAFVVDGWTYICVALTSGMSKTCTTLPTVDNFTSLQILDGIYWRLQKKGVSSSASASNIVFNGIVHNSPQLGVIAKYFVDYGGGGFSRSLHPSIPPDQYPSANVTFNGVKTTRGFFDFMYFDDAGIVAKMSHKTIINGMIGKVPSEVFYRCNDFYNRSYVAFFNNDFTGITGGLKAGANTEVIFRDNMQTNTFNFNLDGCRVNSTNSLDIDVMDLDPENGDIVNVNGAIKVRVAGVWIDLAAVDLDDVTSVGANTTNSIGIGQVLKLLTKDFLASYSGQHYIYCGDSDALLIVDKTGGVVRLGIGASDATFGISVKSTVNNDGASETFLKNEDLVINDSTSTPYTKSTLNAAYPSAKINQVVVCDNAGATYIKKDNSPTGNWSTFPTVELT